LIRRFKKRLTQLIGAKCLGVIAGTGSGSMMTVELGKPVKRGGPVKNEYLSDLLRNYRGEYCVFAQGCAWRLDRKQKVVCGWHEEEAVIRRSMSALAGRRLVAIEICNPALDLNLFFSGGYVLRLFCDQTMSESDNYAIRFPDCWYSVGPRSELAMSQRAEPAQR
jgi:hypothetical protein